MTGVRCRLNNHKEKFKIDKYDKSVLSHHTFDKHFYKFKDKLLNYDIGIVKSVGPHALFRLDDYYI